VRTFGSATRPARKRVIRDGQKSKVYAAEREVFPDSFTDSRKEMSVPEVQRYVNDLLREHWSRRRWGNRQVAVTDGRGRRQAVSMGGEIRLPAWARDPITILHELAHELCPREEWHGAIFTRTLLELVGHKLGKDAQDRLRAAYRKHHAKVGSPLVLRPIEKVPDAPALPKVWRFEFKRNGQVETHSVEAASMKGALYRFQNTHGTALAEMTNLRVWKGVRTAAKPAAKRRG
jgi:putative metallohydrolase (TIGR04338 family)